MWDQNASRGRAVAELAALDHGVLAHSELVRLGISSSAVHRWTRDGRLHRIHRGVYAVGHAKLTAEGRWLAAVKACGPGTVLSLQTAAAHYAIRRSSSPIIHVTTPGRANPRGLHVHRVRRLHPEEVTIVERIPVTSVARTLLDLAEVLPLRDLRRAAEQAERLRLLDLKAIRRLLARNPRRRGTRNLRAALSGWVEPPRTRSEWERDFLDFCSDHGIAKPELNVIVEDYEVDALWRDKKLIVELDSWTFHRSPRAFEEDRLKYSKLQLAGYLVLPITRLDEEAARLLSAGAGAR